MIGGDSYYKDQAEEARFVISRWAKRKVASQFLEEYLDGRQSFIFSWDKQHRPIHEEALRHYFDPSKRGYKFEYTPPKPLPKPQKVAEVTPPAITPREEVNLPPTPICGLFLRTRNVYSLRAGSHLGVLRRSGETPENHPASEAPHTQPRSQGAGG